MIYRTYFSTLKGFMEKPYASIIFRLLISGILLFFLFRLSILENISTVFQRIDSTYLLVYYLLYMIGISLQVLRWKYLLNAWGIRQGFGILLRWTLTGLFLNNFLPGGVGGDAFRLYAGSRTTGRLQDFAATIFYERILSYTSLVILGMGSLVIRANYSKDLLFWLLLGLIFLCLVGVIAVLTLSGIATLVTKMLDRYPLMQKLQLKNWLESFRFKVDHPFMLVNVFLISLVLQFTEVFLFRFVASALKIPVQLSDLFLFVPLLYLAVLLPFSINGIGIREAVFVFFASPWGVSQAEAVAFSLTVFTLTLAGSLIGGPVYWIDRKQYGNQQKQVEYSK
jgi:glycosyltransferase 2 family protein